MKRILFLLLLTFLSGSLLTGCKVDIDAARPFVEKDFGKVDFLHQEEDKNGYEAFWYVHDLDTVIKTWHNGEGWKVTNAEYRSLEVWNKWPKLQMRLKNLRKAAGNLKDTTELVKDSTFNTKEFFSSGWKEW